MSQSVQNLLTALERELGNVNDEIPKGFRSVAEWSDLWHRSEDRARQIIHGHLKTGRMEKKKFRKGRLHDYYRAVK
jgi:hypothetical protein